jgi:hypothetical protein
MKTYTVLYAEDVPHYGTAEIEAENDAEAVGKAIAISDENLSGTTIDPEFSNSVCRRIVYIQDAEGNDVALDISLDAYTLIHGEDKRRLCDAAEAMFEALEAQEMAEFDPEASRRKGYFDNARALREAALKTARGQQ